MKLKIFISALALHTFMGCMGEKPGAPAPTAKEAKNPPSQSSAQMQARAIAEPRVNQYFVALQWDAPDSPPELWMLHREDRDSGSRHVVSLPGTRRDFVDKSVAAGVTYTYHLSVLDGAEPSARAKVEITLPQDLEITGTRQLREIVGIERLFFAAGSRLRTLGHPLLIQVNEIHSVDGIVDTFPEKESAPLGQEGRTGGNIVIRAKRGTGRLQIDGRGEKGGKGSAGSVGIVGAVGSEGSPGDIGVRRLENAPEHVQQLFQTHVKDMEARGRLPVRHPGWRDFFECTRLPGRGGEGGVGGTGGLGGKGKRGGDGAKIYVDLRDPSALRIEAVSTPGLAGDGGEGGTGGPGGPGGPGGALDRHGLCAEAPVGAQGKQGMAGPPGEMGEPGMAQALCLKLGTAVQGRCEEFPAEGGRVW